MGEFSELIKNFNKTRDYVRDFFIYGYKVRNDFDNKSSRTYDNEKRRVESWVNEYLMFNNSMRGKQISISVDCGQISQNPLYQAYYSKSFTDNDIKLHFLITDILYDKNPMSLKEIIERLDTEYDELFDIQTVRNKLKEYVKEGIITTELRGKTSYFRLSEDTAEDFMKKYSGLEDAVKFYSQTQEFGVIGSMILNFTDTKNDIFFAKHNYIVHTLEDSILIDIFSAIEEKRYISIRNFKNKSVKESTIPIVPFCILCSSQTGRRYITCYVPEHHRFSSFRLDLIEEVKILTPCQKYDYLYQKFCDNINRCFGVSFGSRRETGNIEPVRITLSVNEETEYFVLERLIREKRNGTLEKIDNNVFRLTVDAFEPNEVVHWAKTFIGRIISVEGGCEIVRKRFYNDIKRMYKMYRGDKDDIS